jgi:hypothetical protein
MPKLAPFRDYSEHDVINLFSYAGDVPVEDGILVKVVSNYKNNENTLNFDNLSNIDGTISSLFSPIGKVSKVINYDDAPGPIGILLKSVRELDENGNPLIFEPRMLAERNAVLPNQSVPVLTKGVILINDIDTDDRGNGGGDPNPGDAAYVGDDGKIATDGLILIGKFLSAIDAQGYCLVRLNIQ